MVNKGATKKWKHKPKLAIFLPKISKNKLEYRIGTYFKIGSGWICLTFVGFQMKNPKNKVQRNFPKWIFFSLSAVLFTSMQPIARKRRRSELKTRNFWLGRLFYKQIFVENATFEWNLRGNTPMQPWSKWGSMLAQ